MAQPEVAFYVIEAAGGGARLRAACRIIEKAWKAGHTVVVVHHDAAELRALDELLWTHCEEHGFIPHELTTAAEAVPEVPILLTTAAAHGRFDVLVNLADRFPASLAQVARVAEIIDGEPPCREAGRVRFKAYRDMGIAPATHNIRA